MIEKEGKAQTVEDVRAYIPVTDLHYQGRGGGFDCFLIPAPTGLRPDSYDPARRFLEELISYFTLSLGCSHESFIQMGQTRDRATAHLFADHARMWMPEMGLGVWPHLAPPSMWKIEDLEDSDPSTGMPTVLHSLYRVMAGANMRLDAMTTMTGTATGLQLITRLESAYLLRRLKEQFLNVIEDRVFRIFPWYVPLLRKLSFHEPIAALTLDVLHGVSLYIRESPEDGGILLSSAEPLAEIFPRLRCQQVEQGLTPKWKLGE